MSIALPQTVIFSKKINKIFFSFDLGRRSSPLHLAAGYNRVRIVEILLKQGIFTGNHWPLADVLAKDKGGLVPLHNSCSYGHIEVVKILLQCGANPNTCDLWQFTPLHEAAAKVLVEIRIIFEIKFK